MNAAAPAPELRARPRRRAAQKHGFALSRAEVDAIIACDENAAAPLITRMYDFLTPQARGAAGVAAGLETVRCVCATLMRLC